MFKSFRNALFTGIFVVLPITVTVFLLLWLVRTVGAPVADLIFYPLRGYIDSEFWGTPFGVGILNFISTIVVMIFITAIGYGSSFFLGRAAIAFFERLVSGIPLASSIYKTVKQIVDTFSRKKKNVFQKAVLIEFPRAGVYTVGFLTGEAGGEVGDRLGGEWLNVFVPTTPNPTSGFLMVLRREDVRDLDMGVADAMKYIVSFGAVYRQTAPAENAAEGRGGELPN